MASKLNISTSGSYDMHNLTDRVRQVVAKSKIKDGLVNVFAKHTTVGLTIMEWEEGTKKDLIAAWEKIAPQKSKYNHEIWHDGNGAAHVKCALNPPFVTIPIITGKLQLGTWQNIVFIEFDPRAREREVLIQIIAK